MKTALLGAIRAFSVPYRLLPARLRHGLIFGLFVLEGRAGSPHTGLRHLFALWDKLDLAISERAMAHGSGEHPKHRLTDYHAFFTTNLAPTARVLDIGCGYGAVAASIARDGPERHVKGVDINAENIAQAVATHSHPNLSFTVADVTANLPAGKWDAVVLSNILEHIENRGQFLRSIIDQAEPTRVLIRVPLFERHWHLPLRAELGISYTSDPDHKIEHRLTEFTEEMAAAGLTILDLRTLWGEIWCVCAIDKEPRIERNHAA